MPGSRDFGLHIDFARRALLFGAHLAPAGLGDLSVRRRLPPEVGCGSATHELSLFADPAMIGSCFEDDGRHLPPVFKRALSRSPGEPFFLPGHATAAMGLALRQMLTCGLRGALARIYLEAKITELIALRLSQVGEEPQSPRRLVLMRRDRELLHEARAILAERYTDPPTISQLARTVAMNRTKLKAGFKQLFGTTIFGFVRALRMQEAFDLLRDGTCNVTEAANRVGYNSPGAFTSVFKAEYGITPHRTHELKF